MLAKDASDGHPAIKETNQKEDQKIGRDR